MLRTFFCLLLLVGGSVQAYQVTPEGRADLNLVVDQSKNYFPLRYKGFVEDMKSLRASCQILQKKKGDGGAGFGVQVLENRPLVNLLHKANRQRELLAILKDRRSRVDFALPKDGIKFQSSVYLMTAATYVTRRGTTIREPGQLRSNMVGIFDDFISAVQNQNYSECVKMVDDIVTPGGQI